MQNMPLNTKYFISMVRVSWAWEVPVPVIDIEHFIYEEGTGVIIAVSIQTSPVIVDILEKRGIKDYFWKR